MVEMPSITLEDILNISGQNTKEGLGGFLDMLCNKAMGMTLKFTDWQAFQ